MNASPTSPVAVPCSRDRIVMPVDRLATDHNWITRPAAVPAAARPAAHTTNFGPTYVDAKQAAPPRGTPR